MKNVLPVLCFALALCITAPVQASPWTSPEGQLTIGLDVSLQFARDEYIDAGLRQPFPLEGFYSGADVGLSGRLGITDEFELSMRLPFRIVNYESDPVILLPNDPDGGIDYYQENIIHLARAREGVGDVQVGLKYRLPVPSVALALGLQASIPTGYEGPQGTFGDNPTSAEDFLENAGTYVRPQNVTDDVTLGDGVLVLAPRVYGGAALASRTFLRLDAGVNLRFPDASQELYIGVKIGQAIGNRVVIYGFADVIEPLTQGKVIGVSVAASNPYLPAQDYGGTTNLLLREVQLEREAITLGGGLIVRATDDLELLAGYAHIISGRNTAAIHSMYLAIQFRTQVFGGDEEEVYEEEVYEEEPVYEEQPVETVVEPVAQPEPAAPVEPAASLEPEPEPVVEPNTTSADAAWEGDEP